jgi:hypothetical protein
MQFNLIKLTLVLMSSLVSGIYSQPPCSDPGCPVNLGTAGDFTILSKSGISTVPPSIIIGDIGVSPISATAMSGFSLYADASNTFAESDQVVGKMYAPDSASKMTTAIGDMETAYTDASSRATSPPPTELGDQVYLKLGAGDITGQTLRPGVYTWDTDVHFTGEIVFRGTGADNDVFILQTTGNVIAAAAANVILSNGALAENIFWQVAGYVEIGSTAHMEGNFIVKTHGKFITGSTLNGRILAQTAVVLQSANIVEP